MRGYTSVLTIALSVGWLSVGLGAQSSVESAKGSQAESKPLTLRSVTREVDLDIVVTDAKGQPVSGLTKDDFQIFEDHKPQRALSFEAYSPKTVAPVVAPKLPENAFTNYIPIGSGNTSIVLLLDSLDTPLRYQANGYLQAIDFIKHLPAGVDVAIFTLNARMELLQGFTSDTKVLLNAMQSRRAQPRPSLLMDSAPGVAILREGSNDVYRMQLLSDGMATLGRYLAGFPGRKNLVWLTVDIPSDRSNRVGGSPQSGQAGADAPPAPTDRSPTFGDLSSTTRTARSTGARSPSAGGSEQSSGATGASAQSAVATGADGSRLGASEVGISRIDSVFDTASGALALGRVAIYILDPRGLMGLSLAENPDWQFQFATMDTVAEATGGHAFYSTNRLDLVMNEIAADGSNYYRLTYSPTNKNWNGEFRHFQVKIAASTNSLTSAVTGKPAIGNLHLAYRPGYYASDSGGRPIPAGQAYIASSANAAAPSDFTTAAEDSADGPKRVAENNTSQDSLRASMTMGELPPTEILFVASVKPMDGTFQLARNSAMPDNDFMRAKFKYQPYRQLNILFVTNVRSLVLPVAADGLHHGKVEFVTVIYSDKGDVVNTLITGMSLDLREASYRKMLATGIAAHQSIAVPVKGEYIVRLGVHDSTSDRIGALEIPLNRIKAAKVAPALMPVKR